MSIGCSVSSDAGVAAAPAAAAAAAAPPPPPPTLPRVVLKGGKSKIFAEGNPVVFGGAVDRVVGRPAPRAGDAVLVCDGAEVAFAWGLFNPGSMFRVRIMQFADEVAGGGAALRPDLPALLAARLGAAVRLRAALGLPSSHTTAYRLVNAEGDRLSGLVADRLGGRLVVSSSAAWVERHRPLVAAALARAAGMPEGAVVWRPALDQLKEEGWDVEVDQQQEQGAEGGDGGAGEAEVLENGLRFVASAARGQKTGFYADQRDSRALVRGLAAGRDVLDLCCYSGGFALSAAAGGAASALGVDSSAPALALAARNAALNAGALACAPAWERADVAAWMSAAAKEGRQWDVVILDPPKLAPSRAALPGALRKYEALNAAAARLVRPGGLLMTCSCSGAVAAAGAFGPMLARAARRARRRAAVVRVAGAAACHPVDAAYPEGNYLTNVLCRLD